MISRKQAAGIARDFAVANGLGVRVHHVVRLDEIAGRRPLPFLGFGKVLGDQCWLAYIDDDRPLSLRSSTIVVVDPDTGSVVYGGSANDEG
jgi:hypothetical protein